jgi:hypothetical protein
MDHLRCPLIHGKVSDEFTSMFIPDPFYEMLAWARLAVLDIVFVFGGF